MDVYVMHFKTKGWLVEELDVSSISKSLPGNVTSEMGLMILGIWRMRPENILKWRTLMAGTLQYMAELAPYRIEILKGLVLSGFE